MQGACYRSRVAPTTLTVNFVDNTNTDQNFSATSARNTYASSSTQHLTINNKRVRDLSSGCNSTSHAENKHEIMINKTKTPKLGMQHLMTTQKSVVNGKNASPKLPRQIFATNHLSVPQLKPSTKIANYSSTQLSTRNQTSSAHSARSSQSSSVNRLNSNDFNNSDLSLNEEKSAHMSAALEAALFSMSPTELMQFRWLKQLQSSIPSVDLDDVSAVLEDPQAARQFAAEYSQMSYLEMLKQDYAIGDYLLSLPQGKFSYSQRERLISIIQDLHKKKDYKPETLQLAGSIADRFLKKLLQKDSEEVPNLFALAATVMLMAAKMEQPISPSFNRMLALLPSAEQTKITKADLVNLEERILVDLEFGVHYAGPIPFIERYQRLLRIDQEGKEHDFKQVGFTARQFCKYVQRYGQFLTWKPS